MSQTYKNFEKGIGLVPNDSDQNQIKGDLNVLSSDGKVAYHNGTSSSPIVTETHSSQNGNRLKNKDLEDSTTAIVDATDPSKKIKFDVQTSHAISTTTILTLPDSTDTLVARDTQDTLTNKTLVDSSTLIVDSVDQSKKIKFDVQATHLNNTTTLTLPDSTDTLIARNTNDTLTNKTLNLSNNTLIATSAQIASSVTDETGTGLLVFNNTPTLITPTINTINDVTNINNKPGQTMYISSANAISVLAEGAVGILSGNNQQLALNSSGTGNTGEISFDIGSISSVATVNSSGLTIGFSKSIKFKSGASNVLTLNVGALTGNYTISLPESAPFQNTSLFYNKEGNYVWEPILNNNKSLQTVTAVIGSTAPSVYGCAVPTVVKDVGSNGAAVAVTPSFTSYYTSRKLLEYQTVSGSSSVAGWRWGSIKPVIIGTNSYGGFKFSTGFGFQSGFSSSAGRTFFVGMVSTSTDPGISNPSSSSNIVGFGLDNTDTNIQFMYRGFGSVIKVDLGSSFARPTADKTTFYRVELSAYNGSVSYKIKEMVSGAIATGTVSSNLPSTSLQLTPICYVSAGSGASIATGIGMEYITIES